MNKLTDDNYRLPIIEALSSFGLMESGTTKPMKIRGVDRLTGERGHYVVKFRNSSRMSNKSSCRELIGAWIAKELNINVVEPVLINISDEFIDTTIGINGYTSALNSKGINFGSLYVPGFMELVKGSFKLNNNLEEQAKMIFLFDMFIGNSDRGAGKPNVLTNEDTLLVFDHELAFSFVDIISFAKNHNPWVFGATERELYESHYFYPLLKNKNIDFTENVEMLTVINDNFWNKANQFIPDDWKTEELEEIREHTVKVILNRNIFSNELTRVLL